MNRRKVALPESWQGLDRLLVIDDLLVLDPSGPGTPLQPTCRQRSLRALVERALDSRASRRRGEAPR